MNFWDAIIQGIVQGLTEFLPVSSSGHVSLVQHFTGKNIEGAQTFTLFLHFGTLAAVFVVYRKLIWELLCEFFAMVRDICVDAWGFVSKGKGGYKRRFEKKLSEMSETRRMVIFVFAASACAILLFLPIFGVFGIYDASGELVKSLSDISEYTSEDADILVEGICLLGTGALLLYATYISRQRQKAGGKAGEDMTMRSAVAMGFGQCFASMPGLSRSGTTTTLGMIAGTEKNKALEFSFIMGIPAILGASVLEVFKMDDAAWESIKPAPMVLGIVIAAVVGILAIAGLKWIVSNDKLNYFGYYCLIVGAAVVVIAIIEMATGRQITFVDTNAAAALVSGSDAVSGGDAVSAADALVSIADAVI